MARLDTSQWPGYIKAKMGLMELSLMCCWGWDNIVGGVVVPVGDVE